MAQIRAEIEAGTFEWKLDLEDVHLNIEARLTQLVGDAGKRLHTGRSRNDQVATDVRLWLRGEIDEIGLLLIELQKPWWTWPNKTPRPSCPASPTCKVAQPVAFGHHLLAYVEMFARDAERMIDLRRRVNRLPLGSVAWPAPATRWTANASPRPWASKPCARTAWTASPTATSPSNSPPLPRC